MSSRTLEILFVGYIIFGSTSSMRLRAFKDLGHRMTEVNLEPEHVRRTQRTFPYRVLRRLVGPLDLARVNRAILARVEERPVDVLWLEKTLTVEARTLREVRRLRPDCRIVGHSLDDMYGRHNQSRQFLRHLPLYDVFFTNKSYNVAELRQMGCPRVEFFNNAFDTHTHRPVELSPADVERFGTDVGFIGSFEQDRAAEMTYLAEQGISVRIHGDFWQRWPHAHPKLEIRPGELLVDDYARAMCATKINLCFLRKLNRDLQTTRSVEIPACGAFMLAERTDEHRALFEEGREAEYFSSRDEMLEKVRYYLAHPEEREQIAAAGRARCLHDGYSYHDNLRDLLARV